MAFAAGDTGFGRPRGWFQAAAFVPPFPTSQESRTNLGRTLQPALGCLDRVIWVRLIARSQSGFQMTCVVLSGS